MIVTSILLNCSYAQNGRLKAGIGFNYITNQFEAPHLYDYGAGSLHVSYAFARTKNLKLSLEANGSLRNKQNTEEKKFGFTAQLPLIAQYDLSSWNIAAGAGPAYLKQTYKAFTEERVSEYYAGFIIGAGFTGKRSSFFRPEYNLRLTWLKHMQNEKLDAGVLSFIIFLKD